MAISSRRPRRLLRRRVRSLSSPSPRPFNVIESLRREARGGRRTSSSSPSAWIRRKEEEEEVPPEAAASKVLYMVMQYSFKPPVTQAVFAVDSSSSGYGTCQLQEVKNNPELISPSLYPVVEFRGGDFPMNMCFSMVGTKLYFFGGYSIPVKEAPHYTLFSKKVYCIDTSKHPLLPSIDGDSKTEPLDAKYVVDEAPDMSSGKPHCYGFVAHGKLYAIGTDVSPDNYAVFEVYDPDHPERGWISLPGIPEDREAVVTANAVVGHRVIFVTTSGMFSFNLETLKWKYFYYAEPPQCPGAYGEAVVLGNDIYWDRDYGVTLVGPVRDLQNQFHLIQGRSADFSDHLDILLPKNFPSARLTYMGSNVFCYVMLGNPPDPDFADVDPDIGFEGVPESSLCSMIVFQVPKERTPLKLLPDNRSHKHLPLKVKVMYAKRFLCRSKNGADHAYNFLKGCFSAPWPS